VPYDVCLLGSPLPALIAAAEMARRGLRIAAVAPSSADAPSPYAVPLTFDGRYHRIRRAHGNETMSEVAAACRNAVERFATRRVSGFLYTTERGQVAELKSEAASARDAGASATWMPEPPLPFLTRGAVRFDDQGLFVPRCDAAGAGVTLVDAEVEAARTIVFEADGVRNALAMTTTAQFDGFARDTDGRIVTCDGTTLLITGNASFDELLAHARERWSASQELARWTIPASDGPPSLLTEGTRTVVKGYGSSESALAVGVALGVAARD
jgi:hypothetical protein